jgi:hypothetical protein
VAEVAAVVIVVVLIIVVGPRPYQSHAVTATGASSDCGKLLPLRLVSRCTACSRSTTGTEAWHTVAHSMVFTMAQFIPTGKFKYSIIIGRYTRIV